MGTHTPYSISLFKRWSECSQAPRRAVSLGLEVEGEGGSAGALPHAAHSQHPTSP